MNAAPTGTSGSRIRLGNYEPLIELASGGMATVYVARQVGAAGFERLVVIKRVHRHHLGNKDFVDMLRDEARVASMVRHPNVVPVIDTVETERGSNVGMPGELFLVMEYVESTALSTLLKAAAQLGERLPPAVAVRIIADTLAGLHAAHEATDMRGESLHIVHRDVSPQNVLVAVDGASRLIDFGVAKAAHRLTETRSGSLKGKLAYMSPEQAMAMPIDRRVDIFAAGVALHEALTGRRLFQGENDFDTMRRIAEAPVPDPSSIVPSLPRSLDPVVQKALERDPADRYQTSQEFLEDLERAVVPAPAREVAAVLNRLCGDRLAERRDQLTMALAGKGSVSDRFRIKPEMIADTINPAEGRRLLRETEGLGMEHHSLHSQSQMSSAHDNVPSTPPTRSARVRAMLAAGAAAGLTFLVIALGAWRLTHHDDPPKVAGPTPTVSASTIPTSPLSSATTQSSALPPVEGVELVLTADDLIQSVRAVGVRRVEIEGAKARIVVAPWEGALMIDAALTGGMVAHGTANAGESADVQLITSKTLVTPKNPGGRAATAAIVTPAAAGTLASCTECLTETPVMPPVPRSSRRASTRTVATLATIALVGAAGACTVWNDLSLTEGESAVDGGHRVTMVGEEASTGDDGDDDMADSTVPTGDASASDASPVVDADAAPPPTYLTLAQAEHACLYVERCPNLPDSILRSIGLPFGDSNFSSCLTYLAGAIPPSRNAATPRSMLECIANAGSCAQAGQCLPLEVIDPGDVRCSMVHDDAGDGVCSMDKADVLNCDPDFETYILHCSTAGFAASSTCITSVNGKTVECGTAKGCGGAYKCTGNIYQQCFGSGANGMVTSSRNCVVSGQQCGTAATDSGPITDCLNGTDYAFCDSTEIDGVVTCNDAGLIQSCGNFYLMDFDCKQLGGTCVSTASSAYCHRPSDSCTPADSTVNVCNGNILTVCVDGKKTTVDCSALGATCMSGGTDAPSTCK